ncbi:MAG: 8-amino-7-oxononanoate synthase [Elusimicrobiota bacterium]
MKHYLAKELEKIKASGLYRSMRVVSSIPGREIIIDGKKCLNFSSNNYLDLAGHPDVIKASADAVHRFGAGGTASRLITGTTELHIALEKELAKLKRKEDCLVFPSGFQTNLGVMSALAGEGDCIVMDELNHASLWDAAKLSKARIFAYEHCSISSLEKIMKRAEGEYKKKLIVTDSVFSMDGDLAPLKEIAQLAKKSGCWTMIDEAHATGVFGKTGAGAAEHFEVEDRIDIVMGTLSKALGSHGGFVCGSKELIEFLVNKSRAFIYTTSLAPACAGAALKALEIVNKDPERRKILLDNAEYFRDKLKKSGFNVLNSASQIIPVVTGEVSATLGISEKLFNNGIFAPAIRPPTVPEGKCRIRISLTSAHEKKDIDRLVNSLSHKGM